MLKNQLAQTGLSVSVLGLGTVKFGRNQGVKYPQAFNLPSDQALKELLVVAAELGINLLDTAPAYGSSEERLGQLLQGQRQSWVISTKVGEEFVDGQSIFDFSPRALIASVERSLQRLQTDYLDIVLVHSNGDDEKIIQEDEVFVTLAALKQAGKIRAFGMSTKTIKGGELALSGADLAMIGFNIEYTDEQSLLIKAIKEQKGIFIKKALGSGYLSAAKALPFVLQAKGVTSVMVGTINPTHLRANAMLADECCYNLSTN